MDQAIILTFMSYYLRNTFYKAITTIDSDFPDGSGQSKLKTFWNGFTILDAIKNIHDSWEEADMQIDRMAERPVAMTSTGHRGADAQCRSCPLVVSVLPQGEALLSQKAGSWLASAVAPPSSIRIDSNFERSSMVGKMLSNSIACYREIIHEKKSQSIWQTSLWSYFKKLPQPPQSSATTTLIISSHQHGGKTFHQQKD
ncbi:hypothetical protein QTO34_001381 [Cnephaeus nilssonii]|uniref:Uncharacterized protein n=1 Tax=Cnephaeus nilssonii TaxID=3371016 RepID=A0AA40LLN3_CNENI|nr:hypothetical protein QTO34_001381 [Eptesicus nilssonii]